jgi:8-oxo-dGTP pyrophosphatase MutT (NUDIX family)
MDAPYGCRNRNRRPGRGNLPAGKPETDETLVDAAVREAKEESGQDVSISGRRLPLDPIPVVAEMGRPLST